MPKQTIFSGIQPTGRLHLGNYLGSLRHFVELQTKHDCYFMIADYHSITEDYDPRRKRAQTLELAAEFLAAGLDPKKCTIFVQSDVPEHLELAWIFNAITPISLLERMTQYKDKAARQTKNINVGLFDYPVLQAADILLYHATAVPVGADQDQHLELTREIVRLFNNRFGATFTEPKTLHTNVPKVMSLLAPDKKMSKSLGDAHCIHLDDEPDVVAAKISKAVTDTGGGTSLGAKNLLTMSEAFSSKKTYESFLADSAEGTLQYAKLKQTLAKDIAGYFADFRAEKKKLGAKRVEAILAAGKKRAAKTALKTMAAHLKRDCGNV